MDLNDTQVAELKEITSFNMEARYEEEKMAFYKIATQEYATHWLEKIKEYGSWIMSLINES